jgi:hypothetical protein
MPESQHPGYAIQAHWKLVGINDKKDAKCYRAQRIVLEQMTTYVAFHN